MQLHEAGDLALGSQTVCGARNCGSVFVLWHSGPQSAAPLEQPQRRQKLRQHLRDRALLFAKLPARLSRLVANAFAHFHLYDWNECQTQLLVHDGRFFICIILDWLELKTRSATENKKYCIISCRSKANKLVGNLSR